MSKLGEQLEGSANHLADIDNVKTPDEPIYEVKISLKGYEVKHIIEMHLYKNYDSLEAFNYPSLQECSELDRIDDDEVFNFIWKEGKK
jgi:hypothetical protein